MIVEAIVGAFLAVVRFVFGGLPDAAPLGLSGFGPMVGLAQRMDAGLPVSEAVIAFGVLLTVATGVFVVRLALMAWHAMPGKFS